MSELNNQPGDPITYAECLEGINAFKNQFPNQPHTYKISLSKIEAMIEYVKSQNADTFTIDMMINSSGRNMPLYGATKGVERVSATEPAGEGWENKTFLNFSQSCPPLPPEECPQRINAINE